MGTRSCTFVYEDSFPGEITPTLVNMYRQYDGYPTGHGAELAEFLLKTENNGMGCLAASMIAHFKQSIGGVYIYPTESKDLGQEYEYHVSENHVTLYKMDYDGSNKKIIFDGTFEELKEYCSTERYDEEPTHAFDTQQGKDWLKSVLNDGVVTVTFTKKDGTERVMKCTLDRKIVPQIIHETNTDNPIDFPKTKNARVVISDNVLPVYDVEAQGWRSFRWSSVTKVEIKL
jgi:WYL_2, Sm-like SH3 beta-barrel fold